MSERRDGTYWRRMRIRQIREEIAKHMPEGISIERMLLWIQVEMGLTRRKAEEYLRLAVESGDFTIKDGKIVPIS